MPPVSEVTIASFDEFKKADKVVAVAFLSSIDDAPIAEYNATADKHRDDWLFGVATDKEVIEAAGVKPPALVLYRSFDDAATTYPYPVADLTVAELEGWIKELSVPTLDQVNAENYQIYSQSGLPLAYLFVDPSDDKREEYISALKPVAAKYKGKVNFVWIDAIQFGDHAKALNLMEAKWPSFVIQNLESQLKYPYDQDLEVKADAVEELVEEYLAGKLQPKLKSQPIPETQEESVFTVVGKTFEEVVFDDEKDVFIEFYASWYVDPHPLFSNHR